MPCMPFLSCMMSDAEQRRRQFIFAKNRSLSAPTRKKWYRRDSHHQDHDKATLYDTVLAQKLADAIQVWHEFHSSLSQLAIDPNDHRKKSEDNLENDDEKLETYERSASCMAPQATIISSDEDLEEECESDFSESEDEATSSSSINVSESEMPEDNTTEESLDTMEELAKFEKHTKLHGKLSISNPDLTTIQLKSIFPKLHKHWRKALAKSPVYKRSVVIADQEQKVISKHRTSRYWLEDQLVPTEHIWLPSSGPGYNASSSTDSECYLGEKDCTRAGEKRRCAACHIVAHTQCFPLLAKMNLTCKSTFKDTSKRNPTKDALDTLNKHHWVHRWKLEGRCQHCGKSFQQKIFRDKEVIAITCSWCKHSYHNKRSCFTMNRFEECCDRGALREMIVPPNWIARLPATRKRHKSKIDDVKKKKKKHRPFIVKPLDPALPGPAQPLLVFVNPLSGGNKGSKALHTFCWLLNPRQVFDITAFKGPKYGLEIFRKVANQIRILVCGGDGTVGWVLSTLDQLKWPVYPPISIFPLGTGNDLSRCMGWGGAVSDEPVAEVLSAILHETSVTYLDRWRLDVEPNTSCPIESSDDLNEAVQSSLPLTVMNNYFSIGADAHVALQFHHSRSANPQNFNSRLKNRIAYGGLGTIDLFKRTWKDLSEYITIECDDIDITPRIRESKLHCILFLNIAHYAGGAMPWGGDHGEDYGKPSMCDGKIEVLGLTTATLAALMMGGKGERIAQCSRVRIKTTKSIPMQVDGEPCLLAPSVIQLSFHSKVPMLKRDKKLLCTPGMSRKHLKHLKNADHNNMNTAIFLQVPVLVIGRDDYDAYRESIDRLKDTGFELGEISIEAEMEIAQARQQIQKLLSSHQWLPYDPGRYWSFLDYVSNSEEGVFRLPRHQEHNHSVSDICNVDECIIILDDAFPSMTSRSAAIGHDLVFTPPNGKKFQSPTHKKNNASDTPCCSKDITANLHLKKRSQQ